MSKITFADVVTEELQFDSKILAEKLVLELIDTPWVQRLRDISQTGNTRLVYMFSEHSRFGHSLGVAHLACRLLKKLARDFSQANDFAPAIAVASLLHDIGHLAPGSHTAFKVWYPNQKDQHEKIALKIIESDSAIQKILSAVSPSLSKQVCQILSEDPSLPAWTWQIISGGGWNVDRGNWCIADSILAGVSYGKYNISAIINSIIIDQNNFLALEENRLDSMMHFAVSRHAMYKQIYQHRVLLSADKLLTILVKRLRSVDRTTYFADPIMEAVLNSKTSADLSIATIFAMRESWWRYHLIHWAESQDAIVKDLADRILNRRLFKTIGIDSSQDYPTILAEAKNAVKNLGYDPEYYLLEISSVDRFVEDSHQSLKVINEQGQSKNLRDMDTIFQVILKNTTEIKKQWIALPQEVKIKLKESN